MTCGNLDFFDKLFKYNVLIGYNMNKILTIVLLAFTMSANAFWSGNRIPWNNGANNYNAYQNQSYGYQRDNGIFAYNPYDYWDPRWYAEEMNNMFDEFYHNNNYNHNGYNPRNYVYGNTITDNSMNQQ